MTPLSTHFSLEEFTSSQTAERNGMDNTPTPGVMSNLYTTAMYMEHVRQVLGSNPITVSSGYRSPAVNAAVGGARNSAHTTGHAVDFICPRFGSPLDICRRLQSAGIPYDQIIQEGSWVHISFALPMRHQVLTKAGSGYVLGIHQAY